MKNVTKNTTNKKASVTTERKRKTMNKARVSKLAEIYVNAVKQASTDINSELYKLDGLKYDDIVMRDNVNHIDGKTVNGKTQTLVYFAFADSKGWELFRHRAGTASEPYYFKRDYTDSEDATHLVFEVRYSEHKNSDGKVTRVNRYTDKNRVSYNKPYYFDIFEDDLIVYGSVIMNRNEYAFKLVDARDAASIILRVKRAEYVAKRIEKLAKKYNFADALSDAIVKDLQA